MRNLGRRVVVEILAEILKVLRSESTRNRRYRFLRRGRSRAVAATQPRPRLQKISLVCAAEVAEIFADVVAEILAEILRRRVMAEILAE